MWGSGRSSARLILTGGLKKSETDNSDARFVRKHDRDRHVATTHKNEKSFMCDDCGQNFARSDALLRHRAKRDACKARMG